MKSLFYTKTLVALAVAVAAAAGTVSQAQEQPIPPPATDSSLPAGVAPGSPLADVLRMLQAGVDVATIKTYVLNAQSPFNLDADMIIYLKDAGAPSDLINAMMDRDKALFAASATPPPPAPVPPPPTDTAVPDTAPPATDVTLGYFNDTLTPYGSWVDVDGYGRCWRPTVVIYNSSWSPYCDSGHWVYTDSGWYWDSDYSWGVTFHYGRWFRNPRFGWCWYPDTVWAPSWVAWRSGGDYCGWAPLPPFAVFHPGVGFFYRGVSVGVNFDFGLSADCFVFVSPDHFCDRRPRSFCVPRERVTAVFHQTTIINNYDIHGKTIVNRGIGVDRIAAASHRQIQPIHVASLPNAGRQGWRGPGFEQTMHSPSGNHAPNFGNNSAGHNFTGGNNDFRHGPENHNAEGAVNTVHHDNSPAQSPQPGHQTDFYRPQNQNPQPGNHVQPESGIHQPEPPQVRQNNSYPESGRAGSQYNQSQQQNNQWQQGRGTTAIPDYSQQHGAGQLQQHNYGQPEQPHQDYNQNNGESLSHNQQGSPQPQARPQPRQGQGNGSNNGNNNGQNRQNHQ